MLAIIGAGEAATAYLNSIDRDEDFRVFTTYGSGYFAERKVEILESLEPQLFNKIVIASQFVDEILDAVKSKHFKHQQLFWFDHLFDREIPVDSMAYADKQDSKVLYAVYDLGIYPPTYDIMAFLSLAENQRLEKACDSIELVLVKGKFGGGSHRSVVNYGEEGQSWRLHNLLIPSIQLLPSCSGLSIHSSRAEALAKINGHASYPVNLQSRPVLSDYSLKKLQHLSQQGFDPKVLQAPSQARKFVNKLTANCAGKFIIVITLREYTHQQERNSDFNFYQSLIDSLDPLKYEFFLVRDTEQAMANTCPIMGVVEVPAASHNLSLRMALYEIAGLNLSVSSGPACGLLWLSAHCRYLVTHVRNDKNWNSSKEFLEKYQGLVVGQDLTFANKHQRICWSSDNIIIKQQFFELLESIER